MIQQKHTANGYPNRNLTFEKGEGVWLIDNQGDKYLDMFSNFGVNILGYGNGEVNGRIKEQIDNLVNLHHSFNSSIRSEATLSLVSRIGLSGFGSLSRVFWSSSGAEAVEAALKYAVLYTGKKKFIAVSNSYHGKTLGALSVSSSGGGKYRKPFENNLLNVEFIEYGNSKILEKIISEGFAAFILEPIQGEGGVIIPPEDYLPGISKLCQKNGVLLIMDEIQTGLGRTGNFLNIERYKDNDFSCDILCLGKGLAAGIPIGATVITEEINSKLPKGMHTSTFGGNLTALSGVKATLDYLDKHKVIENCREVGEYFFLKLSKLQGNYSDLIKNIRGQGLMLCVETDADSVSFVKALQEKKILAAPSSGSVFRFLPPLVVEKEHIDIVLDALEDICRSFYDGGK